MGDPLSEECHGCGWDFSYGGGFTNFDIWDGVEKKDVPASFCKVCMHATISRQGQLHITHIESLGYMLAHCTNLILRAIREAKPSDQ